MSRCFMFEAVMFKVWKVSQTEKLTRLLKWTYFRMKLVIQHTRNCPRKKTGPKQQGPCSICKQVMIHLCTTLKHNILIFQFIALCCYHAKRCAENVCRIPYCSLIKKRLKQQRELQNQQNTPRREMNVAYSVISSTDPNVINRPIDSSNDNQSDQNASGWRSEVNEEVRKHLGWFFIIEKINCLHDSWTISSFNTLHMKNHCHS